MINIIYNGEQTTTASGVVADFLQEIESDSAISAIVLNQQFIPGCDYATTLLNDGDQLELLVPMQGG